MAVSRYAQAASLGKSEMNEAVRKVSKRLHYPIEVMLVCVRWYAAYPSSLRQIEVMMAERAEVVDHKTIRRWSIKMTPVPAAVFRGRKRPVGTSRRMDETYIKVSGEWKYLYRAVDRAGPHGRLPAACAPRSRRSTFLLRTRHRPARRARENHDRQERRQHSSDGQCAHRLGRRHRDAAIAIPQQLHRTRSAGDQTRRATGARVQVVSFRCARAIMAGIETMHMIKKRQLDFVKDRTSSAANKFCSLAS